ncbi:Uncharacterised protein [Mycobacteroides abscessus subsp. massiliense]|nr:Uncharacterised protein [Mycobacteroides abscessus subsp. massiliense]
MARLDHARHQEDLVVTGQAVDDDDDQHDDRCRQRCRGEIQPFREVSVDEYPRQDAHRGTQTQGAHDGRLDGQHERAERQEHQDRGDADQDHDHEGEFVEDGVDGVLLQGGRATDVHRDALGHRNLAKLFDLCPGGVPVDQGILDDLDAGVPVGLDGLAPLPHLSLVPAGLHEARDLHRIGANLVEL